MRVLVCVKRVPAPGARILLTEDGRAIDASHLAFTTSPHEECAVEEAVRIAERTGGSVTVLTVGPTVAEEQLRYAVSVGVDEAVLVETDEPDLDPMHTARAIVEAVNALESEGGAFDLMLFGNESADSGGYQVGIRVAHALGRAVVNGAKGIDVDDDAIVVRRAVANGYEVYRLPRPAVVGVKEGINLPRYPTLKGRLASKKAMIDVRPAQGAPGGQRMVRLMRAAEETTETVVLGNGPGAASAVVDLLEELGVLA
jgi:electron transfer flavoprotein beta subunit